PGEANEPSDAQRQPAVGIHFDRYLIVRATDAARLHLETWLDVVERLLEYLERIVPGALLDDVEALIEDVLCGALLAVVHHRVDELGDQRAGVHRIGGKFALWNLSSTRHFSSSNRAARPS